MEKQKLYDFQKEVFKNRKNIDLVQACYNESPKEFNKIFRELEEDFRTYLAAISYHILLTKTVQQQLY